MTQLAQLNVGRLMAQTDDPRVAEFMAALDLVNGLGKRMTGFVWNTVHRQFYERRAEWFEALGRMHFVMWHVVDGHRPTLDEALERLAHLEAEGDSDHAFGWSHLEKAKVWRARTCAATAAG